MRAAGSTELPIHALRFPWFARCASRAGPVPYGPKPLERREKPMSEHPNVTTVNRMTEAIVEEDRETLASLFTDDFVYHLRGPFTTAGDHLGVAGSPRAIRPALAATGGGGGPQPAI